MSDFEKQIQNLPLAKPKRKNGKWIPDKIAAYYMPNGQPRWLCSECGWRVGKHQTAFCPNCGSYNGGDSE